MLMGFGLGLTCPSGQVLTNMYDGSQKCCGVPGTTCEEDPCSYCNSPQYVATQQQAQANALLPGGAGPMGAALLKSIAQYPQNVQKDAINCVSNPGLTFTDDAGISITCPQAYTMDNGIPVSIYTAAQLAAMLQGGATPVNETPVNVIGTSIPASFLQSVLPTKTGTPTVQPNLPAVSSTPANQPATSSTPAGSTVTTSTPAASSNSSSTSTMDLSFLTGDTLISGIPNWGVAFAAIAALMILPSLIGGRR